MLVWAGTVVTSWKWPECPRLCMSCWCSWIGSTWTTVQLWKSLGRGVSQALKNSTVGLARQWRGHPALLWAFPGWDPTVLPEKPGSGQEAGLLCWSHGWGGGVGVGDTWSVSGSVPAQLLPVGRECRQRLNCFLHFPQRKTPLSPGAELEGSGHMVIVQPGHPAARPHRLGPPGFDSRGCLGGPES